MEQQEKLLIEKVFNVKILTAELDGKSIQFTKDTKFWVQVSCSKNKKSGYKSPGVLFTGNLQGALIHYNGINIHNGYKKRLVMQGWLGPGCCFSQIIHVDNGYGIVLAKQAS